MLMPTGMSSKEKVAHVKANTHMVDPKKINVGPAGGLRQPKVQTSKKAKPSAPSSR